MNLVLTLSVLLAAVVPVKGEYPAAWTQAVEPVRIVGNIYYVGTADLGAYLIAGDEGLILLDAPMEENTELVLSNIRKLGFDPEHIEVLLNSHAHFDHGGGLAEMKRVTGAKLHMSAPDAELAKRGGRDDFAFGDSFPYAPVAPDAIIEDKQTIHLGKLAMTAHITPGHTKGCTTWTTTVAEEGAMQDVVFLCSVSAPGYQLVDNEKYPEIMDDYRQSFARLDKLDADVFLANHGSMFGLTEKLAKVREGAANPFIDESAMDEFLDRAWKALQKQKEKQEKEESVE